MTTTKWHEKLRAWLFTILPHHAISRLVYVLTRYRGPGVHWGIKTFIKAYGVQMQDALDSNPEAYDSFNLFFTRALKPGARPIADNSYRLCCPVDGTVSQLGRIEAGAIFQAKGVDYSCAQLLGNSDAAKRYANGSFATIYLAPYNYHRIHMPCDAQLKTMRHVPGRLFSVAQWTVRAVPGLFARNERVVCEFDTAFGAMTMVLVGAINVAAIETVWAGLITPPKGKHIQSWDYDTIRLAKGAEMGRFNMGSTVILLFENPQAWHSNLQAAATVEMGQPISEREPDAD